MEKPGSGGSSTVNWLFTCGLTTRSGKFCNGDGDANIGCEGREGNISCEGRERNIGCEDNYTSSMDKSNNGAS
ncbi:hypothetical protein E2562_037016 [Oryza meyeriana var. granulata]|uniref:Uncharacterized protein n=1 Tax=Oryza meyeriana var. granulata TaxID=110450 RepID=A0A6G1CL81_9ORYZ|nr:hypothetical protein E2562_037016 [Oryza meyeriana var. granulata]